jgi:serpin B
MEDEMNTHRMLQLGLAMSLMLSVSSSSSAAGDSSKDANSLAQSNSAFAVDLYSELRTADGNLFFSPYSISTALAMTYGGAQGRTAEEMAQALRFGLDPDDVHRAFEELEAHLEAVRKQGQIDLHVANSLWPQKGYRFLDNYVSLTKRHYGVSVTPLDYANDTEEARQTINRWVEARTRDRIKDLISRGSLDAATRLVLVNAIYFKANWATPFNPSMTYPGRFSLPDGREVEVPTMLQEGDFRYKETERAQILEIPYEGDDLSMLVILPTGGHSLQDVEDVLTAEDLRRWPSELLDHTVRVHLPRFTMRWGTTPLNDPLQSLGMRDAFSPGRADFSGMDGTRSLFISNVLHQAFVEVNEEGSEAAAATAVVMEKCSFGHKSFVADHPFLFLIRDNVSGSILFMGRLVNP